MPLKNTVKMVEMVAFLLCLSGRDGVVDVQGIFMTWYSAVTLVVLGITNILNTCGSRD